MFESILLVVPTYNNMHYYIDRLLDYYEGIGVSILIADNSPKPYVLDKKFQNVTYVNFKDTSYTQKMFQVTQTIKQKYAVICGHDDFLIPEAIQACVEFLDQNIDYASAQGSIINFYERDTIVFTPYATHGIGMDVNQTSAEERIKFYFKSYIYLFNAVQRSENLKQIFEIANDQLLSGYLDLIQYIADFIPLINGKHKVLPVFSYAREHRGSSGLHDMINIGQIAKMEKYKAVYERFCELLAMQICKNEKMNQALAQGIVKTGVVLLQQAYSAASIPVSVSSPFKNRRLKKLVALIPFINKIKKMYISMVVKKVHKKREKKGIELIQETKGHKGFPFFDPDAKQQLERVEKVIKKHDLKSRY